MPRTACRPFAISAAFAVLPRRWLGCAALLGAVALSGCDKPPQAQEAAAGAQQQQRPQAIPVGVVVATPGEVALVTELPGRVQARRVAQVRARSAGILQQRLFDEGSDVKAGQLLYRIDAEPYEAARQSAEANVARAKANLAQATAQLERYRPLVAANAISKQDFDNAEAAHQQALAEVQASEAALRSAEINLGYTQVTAPIAGRIGQSLVTEGALVGQGEPTQLAVIQQIDPVFVNFTQSASEVFRLRRAMEQGELKQLDGGQLAGVEVRLEDGTLYGHTGKLLFSDLTVDSSTGQVTLRAEVPNPQGHLLPGMYVRVRVEQARAANAIALPQQAVTRTEAGDMVNVVSDDGRVTPRPVQITTAAHNQWLVSEGLQPGEKVMVDGFQTLMMVPPGTPVMPVPWQGEKGTSAAGAAQEQQQ